MEDMSIMITISEVSMQIKIENIRHLAQNT